MRGRHKRALAALGAGLVLGTFAWPVERPPQRRPALVSMAAERVLLDEGDPSRSRLGGLKLLDLWVLSSRDVRFGGISAMHVEGGQVLAFSDSGSVFRFPVPRRAGALPLRIERLARGPGDGSRKSDRDVESIAALGAQAWLLFEGHNQVWRYRRPDLAVEASAAPAALRELPWSRGPEAMARLPDGRFLVFSEGPVADDGTTPLILFAGDPALAATRTERLRYRPPAGYRPTEAALLPDGRILVLNRNFDLWRGWEAILSIATRSPVRAGAVVEARTLAAFTGRVTRDNLEAMTVTREGRRTIVWIASDDNFLPIQRTLLMKFALTE
ncbi:MAG TPA: esterase-like activity of phytase family protein [Allosphingosinicella sp.]|nr:esterase-like activity of phytase family protein [Allosphingosinicella sp.]